MPNTASYFRYHRLDAPNIDTEALAQQLHDAQVAQTAAKRLDDFDRLKKQHAEHHKGQVKLALGTAGILLGISPSVPSAAASCVEHHGLGWDCAARISALLGGLIALGVTLWGAYDLAMAPNKFSAHLAKMNAELERKMHAKVGDAPVPHLFDCYQSMTPSQRVAFRAHLHAHARHPEHV